MILPGTLATVAACGFLCYTGEISLCDSVGVAVPAPVPEATCPRFDELVADPFLILGPSVASLTGTRFAFGSMMPDVVRVQ